MKQCLRCGHEWQEGAKFCANCGAADVRVSQDEINAGKYPLDPYELGYWSNFKLVFIKKYSEFTGRASRSEYWRFSLASWLISILINLVVALVANVANMGMGITIAGYIVLAVFGLVTIIPSIAVSVRRMHDIGKSGWFVLLSLIPIIGTIWYFVLCVTKGDEGINAYGTRTSYITITPEMAREMQIEASPTTGLTAGLIIAGIILNILYGVLSISSVMGSMMDVNQLIHGGSAKNTMMSSAKPVTPPTASNPAPTSTGNSTPIAKSSDAAVEESTRALQAYYQALTNKDFNNAYGYLSDAQRANLGSYDHWRSGYNTTISTTLLSSNVISVSPTTVVYTYQLEGKDLIDGRIKHQLFGGNVTMVKVGSKWVIQDQDGQLMSSYVE